MTKAIDNIYYANETNIEQELLTEDKIIFFKEGLEEQEKKIKNNLNISSKDMDNFINYNPKDEGDYASIALEQSLGTSISKKQANNLVLIKKSLEKIENNCYGVCDLCEEPINIERLKIKMFAEYCISCREITEKEGKQY
jgi:DnaK suppressor protein